MTDDLFSAMISDAVRFGTGIAKGEEPIAPADFFRLPADVLDEGIGDSWKAALRPVPEGYWPVKGDHLPHQTYALQRADGHRGHAHWIDAGGGKTRITIAEAGRLFVNGEIDGMIVIAPNGPHRQWLRAELPKWADFEWHGTYAGAHKTAQRGETHPQTPFFESGRFDRMGVLAINYESLTIKATQKMLAWFLQHYPRAFLVCDESQKTKSHTAQRTQAAAGLAMRSSHVRVLSGTPLLKGLEDLFTQYFIIAPGSTGPFNRTDIKRNWTAARDFYCQTKSPGRNAPAWAKMICGYRNEALFRDRVRPISTRITEDMFGKQTGATFVEVDLEMSKKQAQAYAEMRDLLLAQIDGGVVTAQTALVQMAKLTQIASGFLRDDAGGVTWLSDVKIDATVDLLEGISGDVIVWAPYIPLLDRLEEVLTAKFPRVTRYRSPEDVDAWKKKGGIMVGNQGSGLGVGMNLQNAAANIYVANSFSSEARWQSLKRTDRIGQTKQVRNWDLLMDNTADHKIMASLMAKEELAALNVDGLRELIA